MKCPSFDRKQPHSKQSPALAGGDNGEGERFMLTLTPTLSPVFAEAASRRQASKERGKYFGGLDE